MNEYMYELFVLKCAPIRAALESTSSAYDAELTRSSADIRSDPMLREYLAQIAVEDRMQAERMGEYYKVFYEFENYVRDFVETVLADAVSDDWWEACAPDSVKEAAKRARERELAAGVTPRSAEPLEYTTFGELSEIIKANMNSFSGFFGSVRGFEQVMARLNTLRGPIMHCGVLAEDEVVRLKLSIRDWFKLFESGASTTES